MYLCTNSFSFSLSPSLPICLHLSLSHFLLFISCCLLTVMVLNRVRNYNYGRNIKDFEVFSCCPVRLWRPLKTRSIECLPCLVTLITVSGLEGEQPLVGGTM